MSKGRLEAFSDGMIAILITIMVLELHAPEQPSLAGLRLLIPQFLAYFLSTPVALYGVVLISAAMAYFLLVRSLLRLHPADSPLALAVGRDFKGKLSIAIYALAVLFSLASAVAAWALYVLVALMWLVPDRRIEKVID
jgi:uncharacterized membrane protein